MSSSPSGVSTPTSSSIFVPRASATPSSHKTANTLHSLHVFRAKTLAKTRFQLYATHASLSCRLSLAESRGAPRRSCEGRCELRARGEAPQPHEPFMIQSPRRRMGSSRRGGGGSIGGGGAPRSRRGIRSSSTLARRAASSALAFASWRHRGTRNERARSCEGETMAWRRPRRPRYLAESALPRYRS